MTEVLEKALDAVRRMPSDAQDAVAEALLSLARIGLYEEADDIEPEHAAAVMEGLARPSAAILRLTRRSTQPSAVSSGEAAAHRPRGRRHCRYQRLLAKSQSSRPTSCTRRDRGRARIAENLSGGRTVYNATAYVA